MSEQSKVEKFDAIMDEMRRQPVRDVTAMHDVEQAAKKLRDLLVSGAEMPKPTHRYTLPACMYEGLAEAAKSPQSNPYREAEMRGVKAVLDIMKKEEI